jgi:hypothetical protein
MFLSKSNMVVVEIASGDTQDGIFTGVHIAADGSTVANNKHAMLAVEPAPQSLVHFPNVGAMAAVPAGGVTADADVVRQALKNLPRGAGSEAMQYAALTDAVGGEVELCTAGKKMMQRVSAPSLMGQYPDWRSKVCMARGAAVRGRIAVNRRKLIALLKVLDAACPDPGGDNTVFIEFGGEQDAMVMRAINYATGQHAVGLLMGLTTKGQWLDDSDWEVKMSRGSDDEGGGARGRKVVR